MITVAFALLLRRGPLGGYQVWLQKRNEPGALHGQLEFPGGKIEAGERPVIACLRELEEEVALGLKEERLQFFDLYPFHYADRSVCLYPFLVWLPDFQSTLGEWYELNELTHRDSNILAGNRQIVSDVLEYLKQQDGLWEDQWQKL